MRSEVRRMKRVKQILALLFAAVMMITTGTRTKAEPYKYKVTLLSGLYGTVGGGTKVEFEVPYNGNISFGNDGENVTVTSGETIYTVAVNTDADSSRFYCKGFHVSGIETVLNGPQTITEDTVYVAAYGMKGRSVAYTARFVDAAGNTLAAEKTYYGNVGDKPVITCVYIEGYAPNAIALTKTLVADASKNIFTFTYHPGEAVPGGGGGGTTGTTGYTYVDGGTEIVYLPGTGGGNQNVAGNQNAGGNQQNGVNPNNAAPANQQNAADANAADANPAGQADQGPAEIIDLDDTDVPLANVSPSPDSQVAPVNPKPGLNGFWIGALIASGLGIFALIAILIMLLRRKHRENYQG